MRADDVADNICQRPHTMGVVGPAIAHIRPSGGQRRCWTAMGDRGRADGTAVVGGRGRADGTGAASARSTPSSMTGSARTAAGSVRTPAGEQSNLYFSE